MGRGYEVEDVRVTVHDGKTHAVDGKEAAFTIAGPQGSDRSRARNAKPIVLRPIVTIGLSCRCAIGDLTGRPVEPPWPTSPVPMDGDGLTAAISGEVLLAELNDYQSRLKSLDWRPERIPSSLPAMPPCRPRYSSGWRASSTTATNIGCLLA